MYLEPSMLSYFSFFSAQSKQHPLAQKKERHVPGWDTEKRKTKGFSVWDLLEGEGIKTPPKNQYQCLLSPRVSFTRLSRKNPR